MYLSKQWRESRYITGLAVLGLLLLLLLVMKGHFMIGIAGDPSSVRSHHENFSELFVPIFYLEAALVAFWGWLAAGIGIGKNLGEESGSFLFTRPRRRSWFLWNDWGFAMAQIAIIVILSNLMFGTLIRRIGMAQMQATGGIQFTPDSSPVSLVSLMILISVGVLLFSGLVYSVTYFSTIVLKRAMGVVLGVGILIGYVVLSALLHHYYSIHLPSLIPGLFDFENHRLTGLVGHLGISIIARAAVMMAFPIAAQVILDRSEI
jgi:hypothetical protein